MSQLKAIDYKLEVDSARNGDSALGFWVYLMTDTLLFGSLFATFIVLRHATYGGPGVSDIADMPMVLIETFLLLASSFTAALAMLAVRNGDKVKLLAWLMATFLLGAGFLWLEISEFRHILSTGYSWKSSAFLTAFFTLVGTHGAHILAGLIWIVSTVWRVGRRGITKHEVRRMTMFSLYWHFLDLIWIFVFTVVYLLGVIG